MGKSKVTVSKELKDKLMVVVEVESEVSAINAAMAAKAALNVLEEK